MLLINIISYSKTHQELDNIKNYYKIFFYSIMNKYLFINTKKIIYIYNPSNKINEKYDINDEYLYHIYIDFNNKFTYNDNINII